MPARKPGGFGHILKDDGPGFDEPASRDGPVLGVEISLLRSSIRHAACGLLRQVFRRFGARSQIRFADGCRRLWIERGCRSQDECEKKKNHSDPLRNVLNGAHVNPCTRFTSPIDSLSFDVPQLHRDGRTCCRRRSILSVGGCCPSTQMREPASLASSRGRREAKKSWFALRIVNSA